MEENSGISKLTEHISGMHRDGNDFSMRGKTIIECANELLALKAMQSHRKKNNYSSLMYNIKLIERQNGITLFPSMVTAEFWDAFHKFQFGRNLKIHTIKKNCDDLKYILDWAAKHGAYVSSSYHAYEPQHINIKQVSLTPNEVSRIYNFDLNSLDIREDHRKNLERARDAFVLACNIGLRYSDLKRISKRNFRGDNFSMVMQKTKQRIVFDISKYCIDIFVTREILEKYGWKSPYTSDISNYNHAIKELMRYVGLDDDFDRSYKYQGKIIESSDKMWNLISSHTARRTFVMNNVSKHYNSEKIRCATGHRSYSGLKSYISYFRY